MPSGTIPPPIENIDSEPTVSICINKTWATRLIGQIWGLRYPEAWGGTLEENRHARAEIKNLINLLMGDEECGDMAKNCCVDIQITVRINPTTGMVEQSSDGGMTWQSQPGGLPSYIVEPVPPVTSGVSATKCDAATNVSGQVDAWITQVTNDFDTATSLLEFGTAVLEAILVAVITILSAGTLTAVEAVILPTIAAALYAAWGAGKTVFVDYWSTDNRNKVFCNAVCTIGEDGSFTDAQFSSFWGRCNNNLASSPAKMLFMGFLSSVGRQGLNSMAATGYSADSDCSSCTDCAPPPVSFYTPALGWFTMEPTTHSDEFDTYEVTSSDSGTENRVSLLGGQTPLTYPGTLCVPVRVDFIGTPTYDYRTTYDCEGVASGSHGTPVPTGNYTQVDCTNNPGNPPFVIKFTVYRDPIP